VLKRGWACNVGVQVNRIQILSLTMPDESPGI
jgi:hypothetical protein